MAKQREAKEIAIAVIKAGGRQHVVRPGSVVAVAGSQEKNPRFDDLLTGKKVATKVVGTRRSKVAIRKFKPKVRYLRRRGYRESQTLLEIGKISS